jgi:hypothetical protein
MDIRSEFKLLCDELGEFRALMLQMRTDDMPGEMQELLKHLRAEWEKDCGQLEQAFPRAMADLEQQQASIQAMTEEARQTVAEAERKLGDYEEEPADPPFETTLAPPDAALLANELLHQFGKPDSQPARPPAPSGAVADMTTGAFNSLSDLPDPKPAPSAKPAPRTARPVPPPKPPSGKEDKDLTDLTSGDWSQDS